MPLRSDFQKRESPSKAMTASWNFSSTELVRDELALFATHGTNGILDTGATKSVVGSALVPDLLRQLHPKVREQVKRCQCSVTFRFGNQGTLESEHAIVIPIGNLGLKIAIVKGQTPLLLSNTLLRTLKAQIDIERQRLCSPVLNQSVQLQLNSRGLFLVDLNELAMKASNQIRTAETFSHFDINTAGQIDEKKADATDSSQIRGNPNSDSQRNTNFQCQFQNNITPSFKRHPSTQQDQCTDQNFSNTFHRRHHQQDGTSDLQDSGSKVRDQSTASFREVSSHDVGRALCPSSETSSGTCPERRTGNVQSSLLRGSVQLSCDVWEKPCGKEVSGDLASGATLASVGTEDIRRVDQAGSPQTVPFCPGDAGARRERHESQDRPQVQCQTKGQGQEQQPTAISRDPRGEPHLNRGRRGTLGHHQPSASSARGDRGLADQDAQCRECPDRDSDTFASKVDPSARTPAEINRSMPGVSTSDDECDETMYTFTQQQKFKVQLQELVKRFEIELLVAQHRNTRQGKQVHLVEVFCSPNSELTRQTIQLHGSAMRFGLAQGDLATPSGRRQLFETIVTHKPKHVWLSPTCGPWCSWSVLNESKSMMMFQNIQQLREDHLYQIALGIVLLRHQTTNRRHLHWEQPRRSLMFKSPLLQELINATHAAEFDMCRMGELKDPISQKLIQKSMTVQTTSQRMYEGLHGRHCNRNHEHQRLEGSFMLNEH